MSVETKPVLPEANQGPKPVNEKPRQPRISPGVIAWLVLLFSFGLFCLVVFSAYTLITDYLSHSVQAQTGLVEVVKDHDDTVAVLHHGQSKKTLVNTREEITAGDEISTDKTSTATIVLFDGSQLILQPGSTVQIKKLQVEIKQFRLKEKQIEVLILDGLVRYTAGPDSKYSQATIKALLPSDVAGMAPTEVIINSSQRGVYLLTVSRTRETGVHATFDNQTRQPVEVYGGTGTHVTVAPGQRVSIEQGQPGQPGRAGEHPEELLINGSFINGVDSWAPSRPETAQINGAINFDAERVEDGTQPRARIFRLDPKAANDPSETNLSQQVNRDVSDYSEVWFSLKMKLIDQNLAGGGQIGVEYPMFVKIDYVDVNGQTQHFFHGFYWKASDSHTQDQDRLGFSSKLPQDEWQEWRLNLMDNRNKPARILQVIVGSSGHLYDSYFTDVSLVVR